MTVMQLGQNGGPVPVQNRQNMTPLCRQRQTALARYKPVPTEATRCYPDELCRYDALRMYVTHACTPG